MGIRLDELGPTHDAVQAGILMATAHSKHETAFPAILEVHERFPDLSSDILISLWIGVNARYHLEGEVGLNQRWWDTYNSDL